MYGAVINPNHFPGTDVVIVILHKGWKSFVHV